MCLLYSLSAEDTTQDLPLHQVSHPQQLFVDCRSPPVDSRSCCKLGTGVKLVISHGDSDHVQAKADRCSPSSSQLLCIPHEVHSGDNKVKLDVR